VKPGPPGSYQADDHHLSQDHHDQTGKTAQVATEMRNYRLSILGISESRWTGLRSGEADLRGTAAVFRT